MTYYWTDKDCQTYFLCFGNIKSSKSKPSAKRHPSKMMSTSSLDSLKKKRKLPKCQPTQPAAPKTVKLSNQKHEPKAQPPAKHKYPHHKKTPFKYCPSCEEGARAEPHVSAALLPDHSAATRACRRLFEVHLTEERRSVLKINERVAANRGTSATGSPALCSAASLKAETPNSHSARLHFSLWPFLATRKEHVHTEGPYTLSQLTTQKHTCFAGFFLYTSSTRQIRL